MKNGAIYGGSKEFLKCLWIEKYLLLIRRTFLNTELWRFSFRSRDITVFVSSKLWKWWRNKLKKKKTALVDVCFAAKHDKFWQTELPLRRLLFKNLELKQL